VFYVPPPGAIISAIQTILNYPDAKVQVPGTGFNIPLSAIEDFNISSPPGGVTFLFQDQDTGADDKFLSQFARPGTAGIPFTDMFTLVFDCAATGSVNLNTDFSCAVTQAKDPGGNNVAGVTCNVRPR
jgi:hypothetical protein